MRSMRRGIKEMDLILSAFADQSLADMGPADLDLYEAVLNQPDQDLYQWVTGQAPAPDGFQAMIDDIAQVFQK